METSNRKLKIVYIITLPDLGGAQTHIYEVMRNIRRYGHTPILITGQEGWLTNKIKSEGIQCYIVPDLVRQISPSKDYRAIKKISRILQQVHPSLVHCHSSKAGIIGRVAARICNIPAIFTAHGWAFTEGVNPVKRRFYAYIEKIVACWTKRIICVSEYDRKLGIRYLSMHKKLITIHNGIPDMPQLVRNWKTHPIGEVLNIVVVARFSQQKKNIEILYYLHKILDSGVKLTITFIGDGPQLKTAREVTQKLHLEKEVFFLGVRTDVEKLLPMYDVLLLLSNWEGFPISILEAMRAGLPIIASDVGGVQESVFNDKNGWLVDRNDTNFCEIIKKCFYKHDKLVAAGVKSRELYLSQFTTDRMMQKIIEIYFDAVDI